MEQLKLPDLDQLALFAESLPDSVQVRGLEQILADGDACELGLLLKNCDYKTLRIELAQLGYALTEYENLSDKQALVAHFWAPLLAKIKAR